MKLLLTSAGVRNPSIRGALVDLLGKPISEADALAIPTAGYGHPWGSPAGRWRFLSGNEPNMPMVSLGWASVGVLDLTALTTIPRERWVRWVEETDVLLSNGGDAMYLAYWMRETGLADLLPSLADKVWVGLSAGSMVMAPRIGAEFVEWDMPLVPGDETLGVVGFSIFPHVDHPDLSENTMDAAVRWAARLDGPAYAIDDDTAIRVDGDTVDVVSEGHWRYFARPDEEEQS